MSSEAGSLRRTSNRYFYPLVGIIALFIVLLGFAKTYYLKHFFGAAEIRPLVQLHGLVMTSWFLLFIVQTTLVAKRRVDLHRKLGMFGGLLAITLLIVGTMTAISAARLGHTPGPPALIFLVVPLGDMLVFASFVGLGLAYRAKPDIHKRLMLLSCVGILTATIARIPLDFIHNGGIPVYFGLTDLVLLSCLTYDWLKHKRLHPALGWGVLAIILSQPLRLMLGGTELWMRFATWVTG